MQSAYVPLVLLNQIAKAFGLAVIQAPECHASLERLNGKTLKIQVEEIKPSFLVKFINHNIEFIECDLESNIDESIKVDVTIQSDIKSFIQLAKASDKQQAMMSSNFNISGNTQTLMALQNFMEVFKVDVEAILAQYIGDESSVAVTNCATKTIEFANQQFDSLKKTAGNYIQNESGLTVAPYELEAFANEVRQTQMQVERLQAKYNLWLKKTRE